METTMSNGKKKIRLATDGMWCRWIDSILPLIEKNFEVDIVEDDPDFLLCSVLDDRCHYHYLKYDCPRILVAGEPFEPDFNLVDYYMGTSRINFRDRCCYIPMMLSHSREGLALLTDRPAMTAKDIRDKTRFCDLLFKHDRDDKAREKLFRLLNSYRPVEACGRLMKNSDKEVHLPEKLSYQKASKFTIAFESLDHPGFFTEKLTDAFKARSVPIYLGDPEVCKVFNPESFIHARDFRDLEELTAFVEKVDQDDDLYLSIVNAPVFQPDFDPYLVFDEAEEFFKRIFSQSPEEAYRRIRGAKTFQNALRWQERQLKIWQEPSFKQFFLYSTFFIRMKYRESKIKRNERLTKGKSKS